MNFDALRQKIIDKAIRGELVPQLESEPTVETITEKLGEVPFDIPAKWKWCILETAAVINPKIGACNDNLTITFVPMKCVAEGYNNSILHPEVKHWKDVKNGFSKFQDNDVLLAKITPCFQNRKSAIAYNLINNTGAGSTEFHILRARASIVTPGYLLLFFKSEYFISYGIKKFKGVVGQQRISTNDLKSTPLPLPPLNEQSRIVEQAKKLLTIIDKVATKYGEMYDFLLPRFKNILLEKALHGNLVPQLESEPEVISYSEQPQQVDFQIPKKWKWIKLDQVASIVRGGSPRPIKAYITDSADGINWIKIGDAERGSVRIQHCSEKIKPEGMKKSRFVRKGSLLLTNSMSYGFPYILDVDGCIHDGWLAFSDFEQYVERDYLYYVLLSPYCKRMFSAKAAGAVVKNLNIDKVKSLWIPVPPHQEQKRIVKKLTAMAEVFRQISNCNQEG